MGSADIPLCDIAWPYSRASHQRGTRRDPSPIDLTVDFFLRQFSVCRRFSPVMNLLITTNEHLCVHLQVHHAQVAKALAPALLRSQLNAERDARAAQIASNTGRSARPRRSGWAGKQLGDPSARATPGTPAFSYSLSSSPQSPQARLTGIPAQSGAVVGGATSRRWCSQYRGGITRIT
jgi:hypothetical protein